MPTITRIADLPSRQRTLPPVEEFERPLKGDPDEIAEIHGQRAIILYLFLVAVGLLLLATQHLVSGGAK